MEITTEITTFNPEKSYPYLAVWTGSNKPISATEAIKLKIEDMVLISLVKVNSEDNQAYVQYLAGNKVGYITKREDEYSPLPKGFRITITQ